MSAPIRIDDPDDARVAAYHAIRERDLVRRDGLFVAEGKVVLRVLLAERRFETESVLVLESRLAGIQEILQAAPADVPVYVASQQVIDQIAGFHIHRGVLALGRRRPAEDPASLLADLREDATVVVLVGISNHDNVGSIFRNAAAFNADAVFLDASCCDPLYRKAIRVSVGAVLKVPFAIGPDADRLCDALATNGFRLFALSPAGTRDITQVPPGGRCALFLGSEGDGLPDSVMRRMETVRISMSDTFDSLNVAAASAIALHRFWRGN